MQKLNAWKKANLFNKLSDPLISKSCVKLGVSAGRGQKNKAYSSFGKKGIQYGGYVKSINTIALKMVNVSKFVQRKLVPYRSIKGLGHFERLNILEIFQDSYCAYSDMTIKSKLFKNIFLRALKTNSK